MAKNSLFWHKKLHQIQNKNILLFDFGKDTPIEPRYKLVRFVWPNFGMLGFLFFAENLSIIHGAMTPAQVLHFVSHFSISYVFHSINRKHFFFDHL